MHKPIRRPSPATVIALIALFVALGGTGYAAIALPKNSVGAKQLRPRAVTSKHIRDNAIRSRDVRNNTILGRDVRANTLRGREINESTLGTVPRATTAANADTIGGLTANQLKVHCPPGTVLASTVCFETSPRPAASWGLANAACTVAGRRLPTYAELLGYYNLQSPVPSGGEFTANVGESATTPGQLVATTVLTNTGSDVDFIDATGNVQRAFRCVAALTN